MKTRSLSLIVTLLVLLVIGGFSLIKSPDEAVQTIRSNEPIPYIYYYSDLEHAFVIERADGTDSRLLAQGVMPEEHNVIDSLHWSPSGEYLAGRGHLYSGPGAFVVGGYLVGSDGEYASDLLDDATDVFLMEWAPDKDWLVVGFSGYWHEGYEVIRVIDVANNRIVNEIRSNGVESMDAPYYRRMPEAWSEDGSAVYFTYRHFRGTTVTKLKMNGVSEQWYFDTVEPLISFSRERLMTFESVPRDGTYHTDWIITDLTTGETRTYGQNEDASIPQIDYDILWNSDRSYALVTEKPCEDNSYGRRVCIANNLTLFNWVSGETYDLPNNLRVRNDESYVGDVTWPPSGEVAMLQDEDGHFHLLNSRTQEISTLAEIDNWRWLGENKLLVFTIPDDGERSVQYYDWQTHTYSNAGYLDSTYPYSLQFSPDYNYVAYDGNNVRVQNLITGEMFDYPRHSRTSYGGPVTGYNWHESNQWFFAGSNTQIVDSCCNSRAITIRNLNESVGRELTLCYGVYTCSGFLPDNVLPYLGNGQDESHIPEPMQILLHENAVEGVLWNGDGTQLVTYSQSENMNDGSIISVWDMASDVPELIREISTDLQCESHNSACSLQWENDHTVFAPLYAYDGSRKIYNLQSFDLVTGEIQTELLAYDDRIAMYNTSEYYIPNVPYNENEEQLAYVVHRESQTTISENPLANLVAWSDVPVSYDDVTGLLVYSTVYDRGGVWDVTTGEHLDIMNWTGHSAVLHPYGTQLAVAGSRFVSIWDMTPYIEQVRGD